MAIVFAVVTITFFVVHLAHGKPCGSDDRPLPPEICQALCRRFGCDKPLLVQYVKYLAALLHGKLGESFGLHRPVADALADAIPNTFTLALAALLVDFALGLALGIYQAVRAGRFGDVAVGNVALLVNSIRCSGWDWSCCSCSRSGFAGSLRAGSTIRSCVPGSSRRTASSISS